MYSAASTQPQCHRASEVQHRDPSAFHWKYSEMPWAVLMGSPQLCVSPGVRDLSLKSSSSLTALPF